MGKVASGCHVRAARGGTRHLIVQNPPARKFPSKNSVQQPPASLFCATNVGAW
jgi:hypothetical protein